MVQSLRSRRERRAVRRALNAGVCPAGPVRRIDAGRDDDPEVPPPAGEASTDRGDHECLQRDAGAAGLVAQGRNDGGATVIHAAPSAKNKAKQRYPQMHQTKKGKQWYFGMKIHVGADVNSGLAHASQAVCET